MPVYQLPNEIVFPHPSLAEEDGLLAVGGDLSPNRILTAYVNGIFPWFNPDEPILWWSPDPRCVLFPKKFKPSKSLRQLRNKNIFECKFDYNFKAVINGCADAYRVDQPGTWISDDIKKAYTLLHELGYAHSVETYLNGELVGGLYGIAIGKVFFGESMFFNVSNASKIAFYALCERLSEWDFEIIDNQMTTPHLLSLGAEEIGRDDFLEILSNATNMDSIVGKWM
jgi:leucyl/phenylalanyl-tRNA--protein transferase